VRAVDGGENMVGLLAKLASMGREAKIQLVVETRKRISR
jgi:hypothetical protein